jgi:hypothetical protein
MGQAKREREDGTDRMGQTEQGGQNGTGRTDRQNGTGRKE